MRVNEIRAILATLHDENIKNAPIICTIFCRVLGDRVASAFGRTFYFKKTNMENFFIDDKFHSDMDSFLCDLDYPELQAVNELEDSWVMEAQESELEPVFDLTEAFVVDAIVQATDRYDERLPEDSEDVFEGVEAAIKQSVDIAKLKELLPKLYYPNGVFFTITKKDLIDYLS